jgi:hypothetical protein
MVWSSAKSRLFLSHPCVSIPRRLRRIVVHPLLDVGQELPVERNNDAFLSIFSGGGANITVKVDGAHYTFNRKRIKTEIGELNARVITPSSRKNTQVLELTIPALLIDDALDRFSVMCDRLVCAVHVRLLQDLLVEAPHGAGGLQILYVAGVETQMQCTP